MSRDAVVAVPYQGRSLKERLSHARALLAIARYALEDVDEHDNDSCDLKAGSEICLSLVAETLVLIRDGLPADILRTVVAEKGGEMS